MAKTKKNHPQPVKMNEPRFKIEKIMITGESGHGNLLLGRLLAYSGMNMGFHSSFIPSFGFEDGEGNSTATIIISEKKIGSPLVYIPDVLIVSNARGYETYAPKVKPGGMILCNIDQIVREQQRDDIRIIDIPATRIASEIGQDKVANMVLCGAFIALSRTIHMDAVMGNLENFFKELRLYGLKKLNLEALKKGYEFIEKKQYMKARYLHSVFPGNDH